MIRLPTVKPWYKHVDQYCAPMRVTAWEETWTECNICGAVAWEDRGVSCKLKAPRSIWRWLKSWVTK